MMIMIIGRRESGDSLRPFCLKPDTQAIVTSGDASPPSALFTVGQFDLMEREMGKSEVERGIRDYNCVRFLSSPSPPEDY